MASTIKVNNIQNQCGANIANKCGSTITLGASGDTITLACGASQTGFGRTGTVNWDTTAKTASFTAVSGNGYFVNTTSGAITVTMPASPSAGDIVSVSDYAQTAGTNNITVARNGSNIEGDASDLTIENDGVAMTFVYADATKGWKVVSAGAESDKLPSPTFVAATGGTVTCCGDYKIHTFTGPGTFTVSCAGNAVGSNTVDYLVIAGGGAGAQNFGAGGGAGGYRESSGVASGSYTTSPLGACVSALSVTVQGYPITVGGGGSATPVCTPTSGSNSVFSTITSTGGGRAGGNASPVPVFFQGANGGSGGGSRGALSGGTGNTPPVSPPQGNPGGASDADSTAGGGGGATSAGTTGTSSQGGSGGNGATSCITASPVTRGGGGAGKGNAPAGAAGPGGGGAVNTAGTTNTGGGGGAGQCGSPAGGNGGSGIVVIRYKYQ